MASLGVYFEEHLLIFVENNDMIQTLASDRANHSLGEWILPGGTRSNDHFLDPQILNPLPKRLSHLSLKFMQSGNGS
jgi:hypothetical protein